MIVPVNPVKNEWREVMPKACTNKYDPAAFIIR